MMFQWMSAPVHCCPANHNWTHEPTLNKKNQDSLVMLCLVKKQATRHLKLQLVFGRKHVCLLLATTLQVVFLYNIVSGIFGQNRLDNILTQWCPRMVDAALYRLFTLICQGPTLPKFPCAMLDQIDLDNFFYVQSCLLTVEQHCTGNFLCNVGPSRSRQHCSIGYLPVKRWLCPLAKNCTSNFFCTRSCQRYLDNIDWTLDCGPILPS